MKKYMLNTFLAAVVGVFLLGCVIVRAFFPAVILPKANIPNLVLLGMRFALVDALFAGAKPIVILDDPFVNLDDQHSRLALELLTELAQSRQILYLTCSSSRTIN